MSKAEPTSLPIVLRAAAVWGTTVLSVCSLNTGESFELGDGDGATLAKPDGSLMSDMPLRAVASGWELDARGATGGLVTLRGRKENPADLARSGAPIPIVAGDHGLIQYGTFSVFFQFSHAPPALKNRTRLEWPVLLAFIFSLVAVCGGLALMWAITTPPPIPKPLELTSQRELELKFNLKAQPPPPPKFGSKSDKGKGIPNPGAKDKKKSGGGRKMAHKEGALGRNADKNKTELPGEIRNGLGGMSDVLNSDVGKQVRETLGTISSVADALGGLRSDRIVLGRGPGKGLHGTGSGGGGIGPGVPFGAGTLDTGWGPGKGGGYGSGHGGPGGRGAGGYGKSGHGRGNGVGGGEHKVQGVGNTRPGQGLTGAQIARVVDSRYGAFRACYEIASARNPNLRGSVSVAWSITPGGSVAGAHIAGSSLGNQRVEGCILRQFQRLHFPVADKPTGASWTFAFRPSHH